MRRVFFICICLSLYLAFPLSAQEKEEEKKAEKKETSVFTIGEIVVKDRAIANIEDAATSTEITKEDIAIRSDKTLDDSLRMVPGITVKTHGKGATRFFLRGYDQDKVVVLVDGIPLTDVYEANVDISQIPVMNISKIVINRGVSSALYGTQGLIGSINVVTAKPARLFAEANAEYGEQNNYTLNVAVGAPIGKFYCWITGTVINSDGYEVSESLDKSERRKWFDKLLPYTLYGQTFSTVTLLAKDSYITDTGTWDHTEFRKYQVSGKAGYEINSKMETGISASYFLNEMKSNTFQANLYSTYDPATREWSDPSASTFTNDGRRACFQNRAFYWPEYYNASMAPYFSYTSDDLTVKVSLFFQRLSNTLKGYASTDHTVFMFPPSVYQPSGSPYGSDRVQSIWTETSYGIHVFPSYKILPWNKLNAAFMFRVDSHKEQEKAFDDATNVISIMGTGIYKTKYMEAQALTVALEDEMDFKVLQVSAGISYDAQNLTEYSRRSRDLATLNQMVDGYMPKEDSMIWGTRDSFNPVIGVTSEPIKDLLILRGAGSIKSRFPTLSAYTDIAAEEEDLKIKPERAYNANVGFELLSLNRTVSFRADYFYTKFDDKIESVYIDKYGDHYSTNIDGVLKQGVETSINWKAERIAGLCDISLTMSYTYVQSENLDNSPDADLNKGDKIEESPEHHFIGDLRFDFITKTSLVIFGQYVMNQIKYVMKEAPPTGTAMDYDTKYFKEVELHNPFFLNIKISQTFMERYTVYIMCKNVLDDYDADPFNPGPGRMFYFGGGAKL
jgi:iron complex outermembrane receptor protein